MSNKRHPNPDNSNRDQYKRHVDGDITVSGQLEIHSPPDVAEAGKSDRNNERTYRKRTFIVSAVTLASVTIYSAIAFWQGCLLRQSINASTAQFQLDHRAWVGIPEEKDGDMFISPLQFDADLTAHVLWNAKLKNFGNYAAQNAFGTAMLALTDYGESVAKIQREMCSEEGDENVGELIFPGITVPFHSLHPATSQAAKGGGTKKPTQVYLVGCISYRDQFTTLWHTGFVYWLIDPRTERPFVVVPVANIQINGEWQVWHKSLREEESITHRKLYGDKN